MDVWTCRDGIRVEQTLFTFKENEITCNVWQQATVSEVQHLTHAGKVTQCNSNN